MSHPKVVLIGSRASGKSTLVASISGILLDTSTTCPIEWNMCRAGSGTWSAQVSVAYYRKTLFGSKKFLAHRPMSVTSKEDPCSTPDQLLGLLRKAEILAFSPGQDLVAILSMDEIAVARNYSRILLSSSHSKGVVYVNLLIPGFTSCGITIIDLPGFRETGYTNTISYVRSIAHFYAAQEDAIIAFVVRITEPKHKARALRAIDSVVKLRQGTSVILTHAQDDLADTSWLKILTGTGKIPYDTLHFHIPNLRSPFAFTEIELLRLRQDEAAYFLFSKSWFPSRSLAAKSGTTNILRQWNHAGNLQRNKSVLQSARIMGWKCIFVVLLLTLLAYAGMPSQSR